MGQFEHYTSQAQLAMTYAREIAFQFQHRMIGPEHLLLGIVRTRDAVVESLFAHLQVDTMRLCQAIGFVIGRGSAGSMNSEPAFNALAQAALARAEQEALLVGEGGVGVEHLLLGVLDDDESVAASVLESFDVTLFSVRQHLDFLFRYGRDQALSLAHYQQRYIQTPLLNQVSRDLTAEAVLGTLDPLIGRASELERTMQILSRRSKNNLVLIGPAGVGKTALAEGLAQRIVAGQVPENLLHARVVALDVSLLTVGARFRGDFEERMHVLMREVVQAGNLIIVVDELQTLLGAGVADGSVTMANMFKPLLTRGEFRCIGAATFDDYRRTIEHDPALDRRFQPLVVAEASSQETLEILHGLRSRYAGYHRVVITDEALQAAVQLSNRYLHQRFQPDKAIDLLDEASARACVHLARVPRPLQRLREVLIRVRQRKEEAIRQRDYPLALRRRSQELRLSQQAREWEEQWYATRNRERPVVSAPQIAEIVALWTGIPVGQVAATQAQCLLRLEETLHRRVVGQDEAICLVARAVRRAYANIRDQRRPIGSFLFVGPTGVGKSELARALTAALFKDEQALLTLDMSEFIERHQAARLLGSPPGYIGYDDGGQLTEFVRRHPYCILLFDEIEKAHSDVFDLLLQIFEDGRLTDARGRAADFKNAIVILTSNLGTQQAPAGRPALLSYAHAEKASLSTLREQTLSAVRDFFHPELLQRLDEQIFFHPLQPDHLRQVLDLLIADTARRLAGQTIGLQVSEAARALLVARGTEPVCGARSLRRAVEQLLDDLLAEAILHGDLSAHGRALVDARGDRLVVCAHAALCPIVNGDGC
ncbi:MAG TPA: ATP-dependent Clp protease ATP-binding subunit [Ktedonobacteraceae bacterium]|jgi:ATP-dependent Clp protease ATP-binding subunit ClpC